MTQCVVPGCEEEATRTIQAACVCVGHSLPRIKILEVCLDHCEDAMADDQEWPEWFLALTPEDESTEKDDFLATTLTSKEYEALADYHKRETWVWEQMLTHEKDESKKKDWQRAYELHRERTLLFKELSAEEEERQEEWEREHRTT